MVSLTDGWHCVCPCWCSGVMDGSHQRAGVNSGRSRRVTRGGNKCGHTTSKDSLRKDTDEKFTKLPWVRF